MIEQPPAWSLTLKSAIQADLDANLLSPIYRPEWTPANPTAGFCSVAAEAAYFLLGGPLQGWVAMVAKDPLGGTHWWLERERSKGSPRERFDPTEEQYLIEGELPPYALGRPGGFMGQRQDPTSPFAFGRRPGHRASMLLQRILATYAPDREISASLIQEVRQAWHLPGFAPEPSFSQSKPSRRPRMNR